MTRGRKKKRKPRGRRVAAMQRAFASLALGAVTVGHLVAEGLLHPATGSPALRRAHATPAERAHAERIRHA
jgi:hypothetical protein